MKSIFWAKEEGFSTVGMALALLITLSLIFTCAQVYEINSVSAEVQEVADACSLAAENIVAEFYIVATLCDALTFTLSLGMITVAGLGVVCACIPPTVSFAKTFLDVAKKLHDARDSFYEKTTASLETLQKALPFLATVRAQQVMSANSSDTTYQGIVVLAPWTGSEINDLSFDEADAAVDSVADSEESLEAAAKEAEEAAKRAQECKERAYIHDSGSRSSYCMYERAATLAGLGAADNPYFSSVDTWNFSAALKRAQAYYRARYSNEKPQGSSVNEKANSALRKRFYAYAVGEVAKGYVHETSASFEASFPLLPKNTDEMRSTELYTEAVYPKTQFDGHYVLHAWEGCPGASSGSACGVGSIQEMDGNAAFATCSICEFKPSSMGSVAAASTNIENGFEYHYNEVAKAAAEYQQARAELDPAARKVKDQAQTLLNGLKDALGTLVSQRITVAPPGHLGAIALVVNHEAPETSFPSQFSSSQTVMGPRVALSASTLVEENSEEGKNVINSFLDGARADASGALGAMRVALDLWSGLLGVYTQGYSALTSGIESALDSIPLASASGLGTWAGDALKSTFAEAGFEPPNLLAKKAVLVNSAHVLQADDSTFSARLLSIKQSVLQLGGNTSIDSALSSIESSALDVVEEMSSDFEVATIQVFNGALEIPITISLPAPITRGLSSYVQDGISALRGLAGEVTGLRQWR